MAKSKSLKVHAATGMPYKNVFFAEDTPRHGAAMNAKRVYVYALMRDELLSGAWPQYEVKQVAAHVHGLEEDAAIVLADFSRIKNVELPNDSNGCDLVVRPVPKGTMLSVGHFVERVTDILSHKMILSKALPGSASEYPTTLSYAEREAIIGALTYMYNGVDEEKHKFNLSIARKFQL